MSDSQRKMVTEKEIDGVVYYQCDVCKFYYKEKKFAEDCEEFCNKYKACSVEITKHAVQPEKSKEGCNC